MSTLAFRMALSTLGVLVCIVAADLSEVKAFTLLFGLAFSLALWSEIARVMRLRLWGVPLAVAVVAWAAGFAVILAAAAFRLGWESVVFMPIFSQLASRRSSAADNQKCLAAVGR